MTDPPYLSAIRLAYDTVAATYADLLRDALAGSPLERALLSTFAELVLTDGGGPVADLGCGPGRLTGPLAGMGLDVHGLDLSWGMVAQARKEHPGLHFTVGSMTSLPHPEAHLAGVVAWYSIIHTPPVQLPTVLAEVCRVVRPGGHLLLAFQMGDFDLHRTTGYGHGPEGSVDAYRLPPTWIAEELSRFGCPVHTRVVREAAGQETTQQAYLMATRLG